MYIDLLVDNGVYRNVYFIDSKPYAGFLNSY